MNNHHHNSCWIHNKIQLSTCAFIILFAASIADELFIAKQPFLFYHFSITRLAMGGQFIGSISVCGQIF